MANLITHIFNQNLPPKGLRKVAFYTIDTNNPNSDEYFLGTDNNPLESEYIKNLLIKEKIVKLQKPLEIRDDEFLYCDEKGNLIIKQESSSIKKIIGKYQHL